jgi:ABC-type multidrug transport system fused ATPase/permease subunit
MINPEKVKKELVYYVIIVLVALPIETIILPYFVLSRISNFVAEGFSVKRLQKLIAMFVGLFTVLKFLGYWRYRVSVKIENQMYIDVKKSILVDIMKTYKSVQRELPLGRIANHMDNVPFIMEQIIYKGIGYLFPQIICMVAIVCFFYYIDMTLGIYGTVFLLVYMGYLSKNITIPQQKAKNEATFRAQHNQGVLNTLDNMLYILISDSFDYETRRFDVKNKIHHDKLNDIEQANSRMFKVLDTLSVLFLGAVGFRLYQLIKNHSSNTSQVLKYTSVFIILLFFTDRLYDFKFLITEISTFLHKSRVFLEDIRDMKNNADMNSEETIPSESEITMWSTYSECPFSVVLKNLQYNYPGSQAPILDNISLFFKRNQITAIQGPSGCGKTTLAKIVTGLLNPHSGTIIIDKQDLTHQFNLRQHRIGFIPQHVKLFEGTILDNIRYTCHSQMRQEDVKKWIQQQGVSQVLERGSNGHDFLHRDVGVAGTNLSGGQKQIVIILRTFLANLCSKHKKRIFILDEPTSALDPNTTQIVLNLLKKLSKNHTIIIITHNLEVAKKCDHSIVLKPNKATR